MGGKKRQNAGSGSKKTTQLPTSQSREKFLKKRRRAAKSRTTSIHGRQLDSKWADQFVDAGYKYVFEQVPMKGNVPSRKTRSFPDSPETTIPAHLSRLTPCADIVFGNSLDELHFFDSKRQYTSSFTPAQRQVYPFINKNGGIIVLEKSKSLKNLASGELVKVHGIRIKPGTAYVAFHVDLSAVASGQKNLGSLLGERRGNLHPRASNLQLEDSRMVTDRRVRYRGGGGSTGSKVKLTRLKTPSLPDKVPNFKKTVIPKRVKLGTPANMAANLIIDYTIGKTIQRLESELDAVNQEGIKSLWKASVYSKIQHKVDAAIGLEQTSPEVIKADEVYIVLDWEVLLRIQMNDPVVDTIVWAYKFAHGSPGFVNTLEGVAYIKDEVVYHGSDSVSRSAPKQTEDSSDESLLHEFHRDYILIWDRDVHNLANKYRDLAQASMDQLNTAFDASTKVIETISSTKGKENARKFIKEAMGRVAEALRQYNFRAAKKSAKRLIQVVNGQLKYSKVFQYRIDQILKEIDSLKTVMSKTYELGKLSKKQNENQRILMSMFLSQELDNL